MDGFRAGNLPAGLANLLYNGTSPWVEALDTRDRTGLSRGSGVEEMLPRMRFPVMVERRVARLPAVRPSAVFLLFGLRRMKSEQRLAGWAGLLGE